MPGLYLNNLFLVQSVIDIIDEFIDKKKAKAIPGNQGLTLAFYKILMHYFLIVINYDLCFKYIGIVHGNNISEELQRNVCS